jgi:hypothetical protein
MALALLSSSGESAQWAKDYAAIRKNGVQSIEKAKLEEWKANERSITRSSGEVYGRSPGVGCQPESPLKPMFLVVIAYRSCL